MKKLNLACGPVYLDGYINIDNKSHFPNIKVDMNADVFDLEFEENSIDEIVVSHFAMYKMVNVVATRRSSCNGNC